MAPTRRGFLQSLGAGALVAGAPQWAFTRTFDPLREQAPSVRDPKYREWSTSALAAGCTVIGFTGVAHDPVAKAKELQKRGVSHVIHDMGELLGAISPIAA